MIRHTDPTQERAVLQDPVIPPRSAARLWYSVSALRQCILSNGESTEELSLLHAEFLEIEWERTDATHLALGPGLDVRDDRYSISKADLKTEQG